MLILSLVFFNMSVDQNVNLMLERRAAMTGYSFPGPGNLLWSFQGIDDIECVSQFYDIDGDTAPEVLAESYDSGANGPAHFFCLSGKTGDTIWAVWPTGGVSNSGGWGDQCVSSISDLNGDHIGDALLGTAWGGRTVFAISGNDGTTIWSYDTYADSVASGWIYCVNPLPDIDGDSIPEVLAATGRYCQTVFCFSGATGRIIWRFYGQDAFGSVCAINDVNGDGYADVLAGAWGNSQDRHVYCLSGNSRGNQPVVIWSYYAGGDVYCVRSIADVNGNGVDDALASTWNNYIYCLDGASGQLIWATDIDAYGMRIELLDDINGDSIPEVIVGSWNNAVILLDGRSGAQIWQTPAGNDVWTVNPITDVNGDNYKDVVAGSGDGNLYCLDGVNGAILWSYPTGGWVNTVRSISDVNGDHQDDVIAGNQFSGSAGYVYCVEGDSMIAGINGSRKHNNGWNSTSGTKIFGLDGREVTSPLRAGVYFMIKSNGGIPERKKILVLR
jgi:outer membrane protein assembly factor BamB